MDIRIFQGNTNMSFEADLDAWNRANDSVSRVWWGDVNASTGVVETCGLATQLFFWPNPKLNVQWQTNSWQLWWPANPTSFVFQSNQSLLQQTQWQAVASGIVYSNAINTYTIPLSSSGTTTFYRLVSPPP